MKQKAAKAKHGRRPERLAAKAAISKKARNRRSQSEDMQLDFVPDDAEAATKAAVGKARVSKKIKRRRQRQRTAHKRAASENRRKRKKIN